MDIRHLLATGAEARSLAAALHDRLTALRDTARTEADETLRGWHAGLARPDFAPSVRNLALYLALRRHDLTAEQEALSELGLSSLGRAEAHVEKTLNAVIAALAALAGREPLHHDAHHRRATARHLMQARRDEIFGPVPATPATRILITLPSEAADDPALVARFIEAGAAAVRINCAHDGPEAWARMIAHSRAAGNAAGRKVPVLMDLAGPKVRTVAVTNPEGRAAALKPKKLKALKKQGIDPTTLPPRLFIGDRIRLTERTGQDPHRVEVSLSHPALLDALRINAQVWFDDGKIGGRVRALGPGRQAEVEITHARAKGARLAPEKGVNLPGVEVDIPALTDADLAALDFVVGQADIIGFSFVQTARDVRALQRAIAARLAPGAKPPAMVLKVETDLAMRNLPRLIVQAGATAPVAVMIARGDLAVEIGLERLSEVQEEILWLCEAAGVPAIWATQVLEGLAKEGHASRAETTDAAMGQRAECVMLNKGPYAAEAIAFLARVLHRMDRHQTKKSSRLAPLRAWRDPEGLVRDGSSEIKPV